MIAFQYTVPVEGYRMRLLVRMSLALICGICVPNMPVHAAGPGAKAPSASDSQPSKMRWGLALTDHEDGSIVIARVVPEWPAAQGGLREEDVILAIDGKSVSGKSATDIVETLRAWSSSSLVLSVIRANEVMNLQLVQGDKDPPSSASAEDARFPSPLLERGIRSEIQRSPDAYVAAVIEAAGSPECEEENHQTICRTKMRVIERLAAQPPDLSEFYLFSGWNRAQAHDSGTERLLVFAVPMTDVAYRASYMTSADESKVQQLRDVLRTLIGESPRGPR